MARGELGRAVACGHTGAGAADLERTYRSVVMCRFLGASCVCASGDERGVRQRHTATAKRAKASGSVAASPPSSSRRDPFGSIAPCPARYTHTRPPGPTRPPGASTARSILYARVPRSSVTRSSGMPRVYQTKSSKAWASPQA
jgi:hypothetical protein